MTGNYTFERISREKITDLLPIFKSAFEHETTEAALAKKLDTFFSPVSYLGIIGYDENHTPSSYYGVYPIYASIKGEVRLVSQSGDTMTHKDHGGRGLFHQSAQITYALAADNNIGGVFGFPSKPSYPGFKKKLAWEFSEQIQRYSLTVPTLPLSLASEKISFLKGLYHGWTRFILTFFKKGKPFKGSVVGNGQDGIWRDDAYWQYKLNSPTTHIINIAGTDMVIKFNGRISVGDINLDQDTDIKPVLRKLKWLAFLTFNTHILFFVSPGTLLDGKLKTVAPPQEGLPVGYRNFNADTDLANMKFTYFDFDTF